MNKSYYFSHDCNAKDDPKCVLLIEQLGMEGYGIYWALIETLREQPTYSYPIKLLQALARRYNTTTEKMKAVVFRYELFTIIDDEIFFSDSLNRRMEKMQKGILQRQNAGKISAQKRMIVMQLPTTVERPLNECSTNKIKEKENIKENIKEKKVATFVAPCVDEVINFFVENGYSRDLGETVYKYYADGDWKDINGKPVKNWKQKCRGVWFPNNPKAEDKTILPPQPVNKNSHNTFNKPI